MEETLEETLKAQEVLKKEVDALFSKIDRGDKLVGGLANEKERWEEDLKDYRKSYEKLTGDCVLSAIIMSYFGPFTSEYRDVMKKMIVKDVHVAKIPYTPGYDFAEFMVGGALVQDWQMKGLPTD